MTEFLHLLADPAHWAFEVFTDLALGLVAAPLVRRLIRRHDRTHHPREIPLKRQDPGADTSN